jgi:hypothetical protein
MLAAMSVHARAAMTEAQAFALCAVQCAALVPCSSVFQPGTGAWQLHTPKHAWEPVCTAATQDAPPREHSPQVQHLGGEPKGSGPSLAPVDAMAKEDLCAIHHQACVPHALNLQAHACTAPAYQQDVSKLRVCPCMDAEPLGSFQELMAACTQHIHIMHARQWEAACA